MLFTAEEACLLLHKLEEVCFRTSQGAGHEYLPAFKRLTKSRDDKHALQKLQIVRLALAKYHARCAVIGVGGRTPTAPAAPVVVPVAPAITAAVAAASPPIVID